MTRALQLVEGHPPCSLLPAPRSLIGLVDGLFDQATSFLRRRLVHGGARPAEGVLHLFARFEQVSAGLLARVAFEALRPSFHIPLARGQLRRARVELLSVHAQRGVACRQLLFLRFELPRPGLDAGEEGVQCPLRPGHGPLGDLQHVGSDPEAARDGEPI